MLPYVLGLFAAAFLAILLVLYIARRINEKLYNLVSAACLVALICSWVQGSFLVWDLPPMDGKPVDNSVVRGATSYLILFILLFMISLLLLMFDKYTIEESMSAVTTCINNIGYGVGRFGPAGSFAGLKPFSKIVLSFDMLLGRLEIYPLIMLFAARKR